MTNDTEERRLLHLLLDHTLIEHPLPWTTEQDWTLEVKASDGAVIAKCTSGPDAGRQAQELIDYAIRRRAELDEDGKIAERIVAD